ncbi:MAG TPA: 4-alpha-glucanotransferase, partial [Terriglobales bacterium]|nr:4-alpha-glucanotransferase [Terriglobales bacterium]
RPLLREAARNFLQQATSQQHAAFDRFREENRYWLDGFVLFDVLRQLYQEKTWSGWAPEHIRREAAALDRVRHEAAAELDCECAIQFFFFEQWSALRNACHSKGIHIVGDIAIFVSYDSADVWAHPDIFYLRSDAQPEFVAGVPPDAFSKTGQRWGNPLYRWDVLKQRGYDWWVERIRGTLCTCDVIRLDHFRGFEKYWEIPAADPTAERGRWMPGPGDDLFNALRHHLGELPFIAEDLGFITPEVHALRERLRIPGMKVLQFGFSDPGAHMYLPHRYESNSVVYTGTHDNDTTLGWWRKGTSEAERTAAKAYLGCVSEGEVAWSLIRAAETSVADICIVPMQDALGLGTEARMNIPSHADGNWRWRLLPGQLTPALAQKLAELARVSDRV